MSTHNGGYDLMLQFEQDLLNDILARVLNDPLTLASQSPRMVPRQVGFPAPPPNAKTMLWWEQPAFTVADAAATSVSMAVPIHGGVQDGQSIYTVEGVVEAERPVRIRQTSAGAPYLALSEPAPWNMRLDHLHVSHGQASVAPAATLPGVGGYLVGALSVALQALARVPFSYVPAAPQIVLSAAEQRKPARPGAASALLRVGAGSVQPLRGDDAQGLALGFTLAGSPAPQGQMTSVLPARGGHGPAPAWLSALTGGAPPNLAITVSERGMTAFAQTPETGALAGVTSDASEARMRWQWRELSVAFRPRAVLLTGQLTLDGETQAVGATLQCALDTSGRLQVETLSAQGSPGSSDERTLALVLASSWKTLLLRFLRAAPRQGVADRYAPDALAQRFWLPETQVMVETQAVALNIEEGEMTALYAAPQSFMGIVKQVLSKIG